MDMVFLPIIEKNCALPSPLIPDAMDAVLLTA